MGQPHPLSSQQNIVLHAIAFITCNIYIYIFFLHGSQCFPGSCCPGSKCHDSGVPWQHLSLPCLLACKVTLKDLRTRFLLFMPVHPMNRSHCEHAAFWPWTSHFKLRRFQSSERTCRLAHRCSCFSNPSPLDCEFNDHSMISKASRCIMCVLGTGPWRLSRCRASSLPTFCPWNQPKVNPKICPQYPKSQRGTHWK